MEHKRDKSKPFILFIHHKACHRNWLPELKYLREYEDKTFAMPENFYDDYEGRDAAKTAEMQIDKHMDIVYDTKMYTPGANTLLTPNYTNMIGRLDSRDRAEYDYFYDSLTLDFNRRHLTGKALAEFKYQRYMGEHGWFDKRFMYEESFNTPLVMRLPKGFKTRGDIKEMVQNIDYAPTFLQLAGAPIPADIQGESLLPLLQGKHPKNWRKSLYYHYYEYPAEHAVKRHYGVRSSGGYKLMHFYNDINRWELYNLNNDPHEMHNIYGKPGTEKITARLMKELVRLQKQYDDQDAIKLNNMK